MISEIKENEIHRFEHLPYFKGWIMLDSSAISLLETEIKNIRKAVDITQNKGTHK